MLRHPVTSGTTQRRLFLCSHSGMSGTIGATFVTNGGYTSNGVFTQTTLTVNDASGGPTSMRALKAGLTVLNSTPVLNLGGRVTVLNCNQRILLPQAPSAMTTTEVNALMDNLTAHPESRVLSGSEFTKPCTYVCHPVNEPEYVKFGENHGTYDIDSFLAHLAIWPGLTPSPRGMSTIAVIIDIPTAIQDYLLTFRGSTLTRWPLNTVLGQSMIEQPTAPAEVINKDRKVAEATRMHPRQ